MIYFLHLGDFRTKTLVPSHVVRGELIPGKGVKIHEILWSNPIFITGFGKPAKAGDCRTFMEEVFNDREYPDDFNWQDELILELL